MLKGQHETRGGPKERKHKVCVPHLRLFFDRSLQSLHFSWLFWKQATYTLSPPTFYCITVFYFFMHFPTVRIILFIYCLIVYRLPVEYYRYKHRCLVSLVPCVSLWALEQRLVYSSHSINSPRKNE